MSYDAVFFDLGGVVVELRSIREGYARFIDRLADEYDLPEDALDRWKSALGNYFSGRQSTEYRTAREGYRVATRKLFDGSPPPESEWRPVLAAASEATSRPVDGAIEAITEVAATDAHVGVISDIDESEAHALLDRFDVADCFDSVTTSEAVGHTKPDSRMYETALAAWRGDGEESVAGDTSGDTSDTRNIGGDTRDALMIGDRYDHDVAGAVDAGLDAVAYGPDARGPKATYEIDDLRELPAIVRGER